MQKPSVFCNLIGCIAAGGILRYFTTVRNPGKIFRKVNSFSLSASCKKILSENFIIYEFG